MVFWCGNVGACLTIMAVAAFGRRCASTKTYKALRKRRESRLAKEDAARPAERRKNDEEAFTGA